MRKSNETGKHPRFLRYELTSNMLSNMGQTYSVSHRVVVKERPTPVIVVTKDPGKGVCEGLFYPDGTVKFMSHTELTRDKAGNFTTTGTVHENFQLPEDIAFVVKEIQQGPNAVRAKWRRQCPAMEE